ncbi:hypothetical protein D3C86_1974790 [compost metagenome]
MAVPAGSSVVLGGTPEFTGSTATLRNIFSVATAALSLRVGYATTLTTTLTDEKTLASGTARSDILLNRTNSDPRIVNIVATNGTGTTQTIAVTAEISWAKD